ncbi:MAG TPA: septum formation initiator family protein [Firmicutes bacterium]|nr:septum formation initiator family protein [Candidatus Fermentithermobacillaceae bacterium]
MVRNAEAGSRKVLPLEVFGLIYLAILVTAGILLVWQPARTAQMNEEINRLEAQLQDLKMRNEDLKKKVAMLESLSYVEQEARGRLGMVDPKEVKVLALVEDMPEATTAAVDKKDQEKSGIFSFLARIAEIFGAKEAVAKGQR